MPYVVLPWHCVIQEVVMFKIGLLGLWVLLASSGVANAGLISVNFTNGDGPRDILAGEFTGVVNATGWQNITATTSDIDSTVVDVIFGGGRRPVHYYAQLWRRG